ncbi:uncharacterized protein LOC135395610 [Ornithodoros turicata]|uniref:uncharacterized protein LOC135395610 n=1 Tax=Ornithodoros turicata TaxID=34597 RepID=UPI00313A122C
MSDTCHNAALRGTVQDKTQHEDVTHTTMEEPCTAASEVEEECFLDNVGQAGSSNIGPTSPCLPEGCDAVDLEGGIKIPKDKWDILNRHEEEIKLKNSPSQFGDQRCWPNERSAGHFLTGPKQKEKQQHSLRYPL